PVPGCGFWVSGFYIPVSSDWLRDGRNISQPAPTKHHRRRKTQNPKPKNQNHLLPDNIIVYVLQQSKTPSGRRKTIYRSRSAGGRRAAAQEGTQTAGGSIIRAYQAPSKQQIPWNAAEIILLQSCRQP